MRIQIIDDEKRIVTIMDRLWMVLRGPPSPSGSATIYHSLVSPLGNDHADLTPLPMLLSDEIYCYWVILHLRRKKNNTITSHTSPGGPPEATPARPRRNYNIGPRFVRQMRCSTNALITICRAAHKQYFRKISRETVTPPLFRVPKFWGCRCHLVVIMFGSAQ